MLKRGGSHSSTPLNRSLRTRGNRPGDEEIVRLQGEPSSVTVKGGGRGGRRKKMVAVVGGMVDNLPHLFIKYLSSVLHCPCTDPAPPVPRCSCGATSEKRERKVEAFAVTWNDLHGSATRGLHENDTTVGFCCSRVVLDNALS